MNTPWIHSPMFEKHLGEKKLDSRDKVMARSLHEDGYVVIPGLMGEEASQSLVNELNSTFGSSTERLQDLWRSSKGVRELAVNAEVLRILGILYDRKPIPFQTLNFKVGTQQPTHSDHIHFSSLPDGFMCGVWTALEDVGSANGPLHVYPGSHRLPFYDQFDLTTAKKTCTYGDYERFIAEIMTASGIKPHQIHLKKGDAVLWAANVFHGGSPILQSGTTRWSQATHYFFSGCIYYTPMFSNRITGELCLREPVDILTGEKVRPTFNGNPIVTHAAGGGRFRVEFETPRMIPFGSYEASP